VARELTGSICRARGKDEIGDREGQEEAHLEEKESLAQVKRIADDMGHDFEMAAVLAVPLSFPPVLSDHEVKGEGTPTPNVREIIDRIRTALDITQKDSCYK
jgi:hypothetical protein